MPRRSWFQKVAGCLTLLAIVSLPMFPGQQNAFRLRGAPGFLWSIPFLPQDIGGFSGFQGQDIMGGADIIFKRPKRVSDLVGAAAMMVVKHQPRASVRPVEIARNTSPDRRKPGGRPGETDVASPGVANGEKAEGLKTQANNYYDQRDFARAIEAYRNALKYSPQDPVIYNNLGAAYFSFGKNTEDAEAFNKSLGLKANDADAYFNLGIAYSAINKHEDALEAFKQAVRLKPDWGDAYNALADTYLTLGRYAEAAGAYEQTVRLQPDNAGAYSNLGYAYERLDKLPQSIEALQNAVRLK